MATREIKRAVSVRADVDYAAGTFRLWAFDNHKQAPIDGYQVRFDIGKMAESLVPIAALDGCEDTVRDAMALPAGSTLREKFDAAMQRADYLMSGATEWRSPGSREPGEGTILYQALMRSNPKLNAGKTLAYVRGLPRSKRDSMLNDPRLADVVREIRAESGRGIDTEALFDELEAFVTDDESETAEA